MAALRSIRWAAVALMLIVAACDTAAVSPGPTASGSASTTMPRLTSASIAYDPGSRLILLFGITEGDFKATTWTWDGRSWAQQHPLASPADPRGSLAYDWVTSSMILFGTTYPDFQSQTWAWKGGNWVKLHPAAEVEPGGEYTFNLASDARSKRVLAFGGCCGQTLLPSETWSWDGSTWGRQKPTTTPGNRVAVNLAWDAAIQRVVLFGGYVNGSGNETNDLWTWDGGTWVRQYPSATPPPDLANAAIGYDGAHQNLVLLFRAGKYDVQTWTWDGQNWTPQHPSAVPPTAVAYSMAWDEATRQLVLFDIVSVVAPQTWIWTGSNWERKA
jgi:hypothetical protein